jgi:hypothetical protein
MDSNKDVHCYGSYHINQNGLLEADTEPVHEGVKGGGEEQVVVDYVTLSVHQREAFVFDNQMGQEQIIVDHNQMILPRECPGRQGYCRTQNYRNFDSYGYTYYWDEIKTQDTCKYYGLRKTKGIDVTAAEDDVITYLSQDDSMIRLRKRGFPRFQCGSIVHETDVEDLYLTEDVDSPEFQQQLPLSEASTFLYFNQKLEFIYTTLQDDMANLVLQIQVEACRKDVGNQFHRYASRAAEQRSIVDGDTVRIGGNIFGTAEGEVWWTYSCRPITVTARETPGICYDALPVHLKDEDMARYIEDRTRLLNDQSPETLTLEQLQHIRNASNYDLYLEPKTRRLVNTASPGLCLSVLPPLFKNTANRWLAYDDGGFSFADGPETIRLALLNLTLRQTELNFPEGGIYPGVMIRALERFHQQRRAVQGVINTITGGFLDRMGEGKNPDWKPGDQSTADQFFPMPRIQTLAGLDALSWLWDIVGKYGDFCSLAIGTLLMYKFGCFVMGIVLRLCSVPQTPNLLLHVLGAFFPSITERLTRGAYRPKGAPGPCHEICAACMQHRDLNTPDLSDEDYVGDKSAAERFEARKRAIAAAQAQRDLRRRQQREERAERKRRKAAAAGEDAPPTYVAGEELEIHPLQS